MGGTAGVKVWRQGRGGRGGAEPGLVRADVVPRLVAAAALLRDRSEKRKLRPSPSPMSRNLLFNKPPSCF